MKDRAVLVAEHHPKNVDQITPGEFTMTKTGIRRQNRTGILPKGMKKSLGKEEVIVKMAIKPPKKSIKDIRNYGYEKKEYVKEDSS